MIRHDITRRLTFASTDQPMQCQCRPHDSIPHGSAMEQTLMPSFNSTATPYCCTLVLGISPHSRVVWNDLLVGQEIEPFYVDVLCP